MNLKFQVLTEFDPESEGFFEKYLEPKTGYGFSLLTIYRSALHFSRTGDIKKHFQPCKKSNCVCAFLCSGAETAYDPPATPTLKNIAPIGIDAGTLVIAG